MDNCSSIIDVVRRVVFPNIDTTSHTIFIDSKYCGMLDENKSSSISSNIVIQATFRVKKITITCHAVLDSDN